MPVKHTFGYRLFMVYLDLDELPTTFNRYWLWSAEKPALAWFRRRDHFGDPHQPLNKSVRDLVQQRTGNRPQGPVRLLTHLRYFGHYFNPVSFYYCFAENDVAVRAVVAEVNNTPWGERHCYVLSEPLGNQPHGIMRYRLQKEFHVSPFMGMDVAYDWRFSQPAERLLVHMNNFHANVKIFDATLTLERRPINSRTLAKVLFVYPAITVKVVAGIYFQALRLWMKRCPLFVHPKKQTRVEMTS